MRSSWLHTAHTSVTQRGKLRPAAVARELAGFVWARRDQLTGHGHHDFLRPRGAPGRTPRGA
jgi:hypothetical protein